MPSEVVLPKIYAALKALLAAHAPLTTLLAAKPVGSGKGIYDDGSVPQQAPPPAASIMPYLTIGAGTQVSQDTMGVDGAAKYGYTCTLQVKIVGQVSEAEGLTILSAARYPIRPGLDLTLSGYQFAWVDTFEVHPTIVTTQAGVTTREWPAIVRVNCHD